MSLTDTTPSITTSSDDHILNDSDGDPIFIYSELEYIPTGYTSNAAPFIESPIAVNRAAIDLFDFDLYCNAHNTNTINLVDLGCGDGIALCNMIQYCKQIKYCNNVTINGIGIDYSEQLLHQAEQNTKQYNLHGSITYIQYNFNYNSYNILQELLQYNTTHVYIYLVPKQLNLSSIKYLLLQLIQYNIYIICYHFQPTYLPLIQSNNTMNLCIYGKQGTISESTAIIAQG